MSTYNNYEVASNNYDLGRIPSGSDMHIAMIQGYVKKPLQDVSCFNFPSDLLLIDSSSFQSGI